MKLRHQTHEFRASVLMPSGTRTSKKYSHLSALVKWVNRVLAKWPGAKVAIDMREVGEWKKSPVHDSIPEHQRWDR